MDNTKSENQSNERSQFKSDMRKAFQHGRAYFSNELGGDMSEDCPDDNMPFSEWFNKYYPNK